MSRVLYDVRENAIRYARDLLLSQGIEAVTMRTVAANINIAVGTMYNYFPSKEYLIGCVIMEDWRNTADELMAIPDVYPDVLESICAMYEKMLCFFKAHEYILTFRHWETSGKYSPAGRHTVLLHEFEQILSANFAHFQIVLDPAILIFLSESLINCSVKQYLIEQVRPAIQKLLA